VLLPAIDAAPLLLPRLDASAYALPPVSSAAAGALESVSRCTVKSPTHNNAALLTSDIKR